MGQEVSFTWFDLAGIIGALAVLLAYIKISVGSWSDRLLRYHLLNMFGAALISLSLVTSFNYATLLLQVAWIAVALIGVFRNWKFFSIRPGKKDQT